MLQLQAVRSILLSFFFRIIRISLQSRLHLLVATFCASRTQILSFGGYTNCRIAKNSKTLTSVTQPITARFKQLCTCYSPLIKPLVTSQKKVIASSTCNIYSKPQLKFNQRVKSATLTNSNDKNLELHDCINASLKQFNWEKILNPKALFTHCLFKKVTS